MTKILTESRALGYIILLHTMTDVLTGLKDIHTVYWKFLMLLLVRK